jgi:hypothetical protein
MKEAIVSFNADLVMKILILPFAKGNISHKLPFVKGNL